MIRHRPTTINAFYFVHALQLKYSIHCRNMIWIRNECKFLFISQVPPSLPFSLSFTTTIRLVPTIISPKTLNRIAEKWKNTNHPKKSTNQEHFNSKSKYVKKRRWKRVSRTAFTGFVARTTALILEGNA